MNHIQGIQRMRKDKERCIEIVRDAFDVEDAMRRIKAERLDIRNFRARFCKRLRTNFGIVYVQLIVKEES